MGRLAGSGGKQGFSIVGSFSRSDGVATANVYWTEGRCTLGSGLYLPDAGRRRVTCR